MNYDVIAGIISDLQRAVGDHTAVFDAGFNNALLQVATDLGVYFDAEERYFEYESFMAACGF